MSGQKIGRRTFIVGTTLLAAGCGGSSSSEKESGASGNANQDDKYSIVATTSMVADIVRNVAGDRANVAGLLGESVDPHIYQPNRGDMLRMGDADMIVYSGLELEGKFGDAFEQLTKSGKPVIAVTEEIEKDYLRHPAEFEGHADPHVWMDVAAWHQCMEVVVKRLGAELPAEKEFFRSNADRYGAKLDELDAYAKKTIGSIPEEARVLVTAHDAFGYFARAYGLEVRSPQGLTTDSSPGVEDIVRIVDFLVERKISSIFIESSVSRDNIQAIVEGAKRKGHEVQLAGPLYSDAMGPSGEYEGTYIGMIDHNATMITRALGGEAPLKGMQGKLALHLLESTPAKK